MPSRSRLAIKSIQVKEVRCLCGLVVVEQFLKLNISIDNRTVTLVLSMSSNRFHVHTFVQTSKPFLEHS